VVYGGQAKLLRIAALETESIDIFHYELWDRIMKIVAIVSLALFFSAGMVNAVVKIAHIGDSITYGYDGTDATSTGYPPKVQARLGPGYEDQNDGVSSTTAMRAGSYPYWTKGKLSEVFAYKPDIITIMLGTNDSRPNFWNAANYTKDYGSLIDTLNTISSKPKIYIVFPPPTTRTATDRPSDANVLAEIAILKKIAADRSLPTIDMHTPLQSHLSVLAHDGIHPNQEGYDTIAAVMYRAIKAGTTPIIVHGQQPIQALSKSMAMVFPAEQSIAAMGKAMLPGVSYLAKVFDTQGKLCAQARVGNEQDLNAFGWTVGKVHPGVAIVKLAQAPPH
jgi:acyl-CoA thioesterase I